jgi:hypothetical protein
MTQDTLANEDFPQLIEPALAGLADMDVTVVVALGRDPGALTAPVPANARVAEYIPFGALLPKADVFVGNGGSTEQPSVCTGLDHHGRGCLSHVRAAGSVLPCVACWNTLVRWSW